MTADEIERAAQHATDLAERVMIDSLPDPNLAALLEEMGRRILREESG